MIRKSPEGVPTEVRLHPLGHRPRGKVHNRGEELLANADKLPKPVIVPIADMTGTIALAGVLKEAAECVLHGSTGHSGRIQLNIQLSL